MLVRVNAIGLSQHSHCGLQWSEPASGEQRAVQILTLGPLALASTLTVGSMV